MIKNLSRMLMAALLFGALSENSALAAYVDSQLAQKLSTTNQQESVLVVVQFSAPILPKTGTRAEKIERLKSFTSQKVSSVLGKTLGRQEAFPLWILPGVILPLKKFEVHALAKESSIVSLKLAERKILLQTQPAQSSLQAAQFTYGLQKLKVPEIRSADPNLIGTGVRVGILDTGIAPTHPDLKNKTLVFRNFSPEQDPNPSDRFGHGTHVAGTIVGGDASREHIGVAPGAKLIVAKIFSGNGESSLELILKAMQWVADPDEDPNTPDYAQVVNNSWSDSDPYADRDPEQEPFCQIIKNWNSLGMIGVFSSGNTGPAEGSINIPGGCPEAFSVGATERNDRAMNFSGSGPANWKSYSIMKPEVCAPGFNIKSASNSGGYEEMSGTSMSAPHITGAIAILLQKFPNLSWLEIQNLLLAGAEDLGKKGQDETFGWGRPDLVRSLQRGQESLKK